MRSSDSVCGEEPIVYRTLYASLGDAVSEASRALCARICSHLADDDFSKLIANSLPHGVLTLGDLLLALRPAGEQTSTAAGAAARGRPRPQARRGAGACTDDDVDESSTLQLDTRAVFETMSLGSAKAVIRDMFSLNGVVRRLYPRAQADVSTSVNVDEDSSLSLCDAYEALCQAYSSLDELIASVCKGNDANMTSGTSRPLNVPDGDELGHLDPVIEMAMDVDDDDNHDDASCAHHQGNDADRYHMCASEDLLMSVDDSSSDSHFAAMASASDEVLIQQYVIGQFASSIHVRV